jgi:hypothetical protein
LFSERKTNIRNRVSQLSGGPNYDCIPDQDHGGILTKGVQSLVMQCEGKQIDLFPAFPSKWDCEFKLRAPYQTIVEGKLKNGK